MAVTGDRELELIDGVVINGHGEIGVSEPVPGVDFFVRDEQKKGWGTFVLSQNGNWSFAGDGTAIQHLAAGASTTLFLPIKEAATREDNYFFITILGANDKAEIGGAKAGIVAKDTTTVSGQLTITDIDDNQGTDVDPGNSIPDQSTFIAATYLGNYGTLTLDLNGYWTYTVAPEFRGSDIIGTAYDQIEIRSKDDTTETINITIKYDTPAIIDGVTGLLVQEDGQDTLGGTLTIVDPDPGEAAFKPATIKGSYGTLVMQADGRWEYKLDKLLPQVQALRDGEARPEDITVETVGGDTYQFNIAVEGASSFELISSGRTLSGTNSFTVTAGVRAGDALMYTWYFDAQDYLPYNDTAYISLSPNGASGVLSSVAMVGDFGNTGWVGGIFNSTSDNTYTLTFSVADVGDNLLPSNLFLGNIYLSQGTLELGTLQDGYIAGATVFRDTNGNGVLDAGEKSTITDANGVFGLAPGTGGLVAFGGTDTSNGLTFNGVFRAPTGSKFVTPLTTLLVELTDQGVSNAADQLASALGLGSFNIATTDPLLAAWVGSPQAFIAGAKAYNTISATAAFIAGISGSSIASVSDDVFSALAAEIALLDNGSSLDFSDSGTIQSLISRVSGGQAIDPDIVANVASIIAGLNAAMDEAVVGKTRAAILNAIAAVEKVAQGVLSTALFNADGDAASVQSVAAAYTGANLTAAIDAARNTLQDVDGPTIQNLPQALADSATTDQDSPVTIAVLANDSDPDKDPLTVSSVGTPEHGVAVINPNNTITYTPVAGYAGEDSFSYTVSDGKGGLASTSVSLTIAAANAPATISGNSEGAVSEDGTLNVGGQLIVADANPGQARFAVPASLEGAYGAFSFDALTGIWGYVLGNERAVVQSLKGGQVVHDTLNVTSIDGTATRILDVAITGNNDAPSGSPTAILVNGTEDVAYSVSAATLLQGYADVDGDTLAVTNLVASNGAFIAAAGSNFSIAPLANFNGPITLTYDVTDGNGGVFSAQTRNVLIDAVNDDATIPGNAAGAVAEDGQLTASGTLVIADVDAGESRFKAPQQLTGTYGTFAFNADTGAWGYELNNSSAIVQALNSGEIRHDFLTVYSLDGTASKVIDVTINGLDDAFIITNGNRGGVLNGTANNDNIDGAGGNDIIYAGAGADLIKGGTGSDLVNAGSEDDTIIASVGDGCDFYNGGSGTDTLDCSAITAALKVLLGNFACSSQTGVDTLRSIENVIGGAGNDELRGNSENNVLLGGAGNDRIYGQNGDDTLEGMRGADTLSGGKGNDRLIGGEGNDVLIGDRGSDTFVFAKGSGFDRISDFDANPSGGQDFIDLSSYGFTTANFTTHVSITDVGASTLIVVDGQDTILLQGIGNAAHITIQDFIL